METARLDDSLTIAAFLAALAIPALATLVQEHEQVSAVENRALASAPEWGWDPAALAGFGRAFEAWYDDHFALRPVLLPIYQRLCFDVFGISPTDEVIVGEEGYLYLTKATRQFQPLDEARLTFAAGELARRKAFLDQRGIAYLLVVAPEKTDVYPEHMPLELRRRKARTASRIDRFCEEVPARVDVPVLNLNPVLHAAKERDELYFRNDPHWNSLGAYLGYEAIVTAARARFPGLEPVAWEVFGLEKRLVPGGVLARMMGLADHFSEQSYKPMRGDFVGCAVEYEIFPPPQPSTGSDCVGKAGRVLMFHDSYATALKPFLSETFGHVAYLWMRPSYLHFCQWVEREKPDLVIEEHVSYLLIKEWSD